jgi:hypothetical protein
MGIAVKRHPVGRERQNLLHAVGDPRVGLMRQAVKKVDVQAGDAMRAQGVDRGLGDLEALRAADGLLNDLVEVLHADAGAVHPHLGQRVQPCLVNLARVDLDRELGVVGHRNRGLHGTGQIANHFGRQKRRRAASPVQPRDSHPLRQLVRDQRDLALERFEIPRDGLCRRRSLVSGRRRTSRAFDRKVYANKGIFHCQARLT